MPSSLPAFYNTRPQPTALAQPIDATRGDFHSTDAIGNGYQTAKKAFAEPPTSKCCGESRSFCRFTASPRCCCCCGCGCGCSGKWSSTVQGQCASTSWQAHVPRPCLLVLHSAVSTQMSQGDAYYENAAVRRTTRITASALSTVASAPYSFSYRERRRG